MPVIDIHEAKSQLSRLLRQVEAGEEVTIARKGKPVARLVPYQQRGKREFGAMRGRISLDESVFDPLPKEELASWEGC